MKSIGVVGGGAWGTALAQVQAAHGRDVVLWAREDEVVESVNSHHENKPFLAGVPLHDSIKATQDLAEVAQQDILLLVTPAQFMRVSLGALKPHLRADQPIVICSKGIEIETGDLLMPAARAVLGDAHPIAVLTGPTFASEIARGLPAAITIAAEDKGLQDYLRDHVGAKGFRPYMTDDVVGAQIGSAIKNVIAIAAGISTGRKLGDSARAALITRGLAEMARLSEALGGKHETLFEMCGVGDLVLTCSSMQSRNCSFGFALGEGKSAEAILSERSSVTEGVYTARATVALAEKLGVDMPICRAVYRLVEGETTVDQAIDELLNRPFV